MRPMVTSCYASPARAIPATNLLSPPASRASLALPRVRVSTPHVERPSEAAGATPRKRRNVQICLCAVSLQRARFTPRLTPHRRASGSAADVDLGALPRRAAVCLLPASDASGIVARACAVSTVPANTPRSHPEARSTDHGKKPWPCPPPPVAPPLLSDAQSSPQGCTDVVGHRRAGPHRRGELGKAGGAETRANNGMPRRAAASKQ